MRVSGNAFWIETQHWKELCENERELDRALAGQEIIVLGTYSLQTSRTVDILDWRGLISARQPGEMAIGNSLKPPSSGARLNFTVRTSCRSSARGTPPILCAGWLANSTGEAVCDILLLRAFDHDLTDGGCRHVLHVNSANRKVKSRLQLRDGTTATVKFGSHKSLI
jgi:hypothetical protein